MTWEAKYKKPISSCSSVSVQDFLLCQVVSKSLR